MSEPGETGAWNPDTYFDHPEEMGLDDDEYRDMVKRWVRTEIMEGQMPSEWRDKEPEGVIDE